MAEPLRKKSSVEESASALPTLAEAFSIIETDEQYQHAATFLRERCKAVLDQVNETFDPIIRKQHLAHKEAIAQKRKVAAPIQTAEKLIKKAMAAYRRKKDEERRRIEAEQKRAAQELAEKEVVEQAALLERQGRAEEAEKLIEQPVAPPPVVSPVSAPKAEGIVARKVYRYRITNAKAIKPEFLVPDEKAIGQIVRSMKERASEIVGGIEVYCDETISARS